MEIRQSSILEDFATLCTLDGLYILASVPRPHDVERVE